MQGKQIPRQAIPAVGQVDFGTLQRLEPSTRSFATITVNTMTVTTLKSF